MRFANENAENAIRLEELERAQARAHSAHDVLTKIKARQAKLTLVSEMQRTEDERKVVSVLFPASNVFTFHDSEIEHTLPLIRQLRILCVLPR